MAIVVGVRFKEVGKVYYFEPTQDSYVMNEKVVVETVRGLDEDRAGSGRPEGGLSDAFLTVDHDARRLVFASGLDGFKHAHDQFLPFFAALPESVLTAL